MPLFQSRVAQPGTDQPGTLRIGFRGEILGQIQRAADAQQITPQEFVRKAVVAALKADTVSG